MTEQEKVNDWAEDGECVSPVDDFIMRLLADFAVIYHKAANKDVSNDAAEYYTDHVLKTDNPLKEAQERVKALEGVIRELVELKDIKDHLENLDDDAPWDEELHKLYLKRKPLAWAAAREALKG